MNCCVERISAACSVNYVARQRLRKKLKWNSKRLYLRSWHSFFCKSCYYKFLLYKFDFYILFNFSLICCRSSATSPSTSCSSISRALRVFVRFFFNSHNKLSRSFCTLLFCSIGSASFYFYFCVFLYFSIFFISMKMSLAKCIAGTWLLLLENELSVCVCRIMCER